MSSKLSELLVSNPITAPAAADGFYLYNAAGAGADKSAAITLASLARALSATAASANSTGNTTLTPGALCIAHTEVTAVTGSGSTTRIMILATSGAPLAGARLVHRLNLPAAADITVEWRNATGDGTLITSLLTDGSGDDAVAEFYFDGTAWQFLRFTSPANA